MQISKKKLGGYVGTAVTLAIVICELLLGDLVG